MPAPHPALRRAIGAALTLVAAIGVSLPGHPGATADAAGDRQARAPRQFVRGQVLVRYQGDPGERLLRLDPGVGVRAAVRDLRSDPGVRWATPNAIAHASALPIDPGRSGHRYGWVEDQWNFLRPPPVGTACDAAHPCGVNAIRGWRILQRLGRPDGRRPDGRLGPKVAVVDTGIAYRDRGRRFRRSPDLAARTFVPGRDFIAGGDVPLDHNGHGTHIASTIAEHTDNRRAVTGLGDGLRLMPVRVLDRNGSGSARVVSKGIRWASRHGARVINLSLEFGPFFDDCSGLRAICRAIRGARRHGALVVSAAGNYDLDHAQMPAKVAFGVASTTIRGCLSEFSSYGPGVDVSAPGGGFDDPAAGAQCDHSAAGPGIVQLTLKPIRHDYRRFGYPRYEGTSMAAAHASGVAALVLSSGILQKRLGRRPRPVDLADWLECTARPPADPATAGRYGAGLLDLAAALHRHSPCPGLGG